MFVSELHIVFKHTLKQPVFTDGNTILKTILFLSVQQDTISIAYVAGGLIVANI